MLHFASALERTHTFVLWVAGACYFLAACYYWPGSAALTQGVVANDSAMRFWALVAASGTLLLQAFLFKKRSSLHPPHIPGHIPEMPRRWAN